MKEVKASRGITYICAKGRKAEPKWGMWKNPEMAQLWCHILNVVRQRTDYNVMTIITVTPNKEAT